MNNLLMFLIFLLAVLVFIFYLMVYKFYKNRFLEYFKTISYVWLNKNLSTNKDFIGCIYNDFCPFNCFHNKKFDSCFTEDYKLICKDLNSRYQCEIYYFKKIKGFKLAGLYYDIYWGFIYKDMIKIIESYNDKFNKEINELNVIIESDKNEKFKNS